ncbi:MAG: ketosteroid isomerase [Frondihabitans sp.]|nr:ketosteroid isomerase [Frondihabitans sp.]
MNQPAIEVPSYAARRELGEAFRASQQAGDVAGLRSLLHNDIVWILPGENAVSGEAHGIDAIFGRFAALAGFGVTITIEHIVLGRDGVAAILHNTGTFEGRTLDEFLVSTLELRDGLIARIDTYLSDLDMMNAYFGPKDPAPAPAQ